jgi:hypothetical protein
LEFENRVIEREENVEKCDLEQEWRRKVLLEVVLQVISGNAAEIMLIW